MVGWIYSELWNDVMDVIYQNAHSGYMRASHTATPNKVLIVRIMMKASRTPFQKYPLVLNNTYRTTTPQRPRQRQEIRIRIAVVKE